MEAASRLALLVLLACPAAFAAVGDQVTEKRDLEVLIEQDRLDRLRKKTEEVLERLRISRLSFERAGDFPRYRDEREPLRRELHPLMQEITSSSRLLNEIAATQQYTEIFDLAARSARGGKKAPVSEAGARAAELSRRVAVRREFKLWYLATKEELEDESRFYEQLAEREARRKRLLKWLAGLAAAAAFAAAAVWWALNPPAQSPKAQ